MTTMNSTSRLKDPVHLEETNSKMEQQQLMTSQLPPIDPEAVDNMLSQEVQKLSFQDRLAVQEEIHGVRSVSISEETPELFQTGLANLEQELAKISSKPAFDEAQTLHVPSHQQAGNKFVNGTDFRLRFLRADLFDAKKAAARLVKYLEVGLELFGQFALERPIHISDMTREEMELFRLGYQQLCPFPDRTGRRVIAYIGDFGIRYYSLRLRARVCMYVLWVASDDVQVQRKGVVMVVWPNLSVVTMIPQADEHVVGGQIVDSAPVRVAALHLCISFPEYAALFKLIRAIIFMAFGSYQVRITCHTGSATKCKYDLMSYGVPVDVFPVTETGNVKAKNQQQWLKARRAIEKYDDQHGRAKTENSGDGRPIECPRLDDVCFRYGMSYQWHKGNARFRELLEAHMDEHDNAVSIDEKVAITRNVLDELDKWDCRFLSWERQGWWVEITERNAKRIKVAVAMKEHKKRIQARQNCQTSDSSTGKFEAFDRRKRKRNMTDEGGCFL